MVTTDEIHRNELFFEIHKDLPRQGPGNAESTRRAFSLLSELPARPRILDVGCGPGMQTIELAKLGDGNIVALDSQQDFLDELESRARSVGVSRQIRTVHGSMLELPFPPGSFDVIWAEGSIYIIGFQEGLQKWRLLLRANGYLAATHISWLVTDIPDKLKQFWMKEYPAIATISENLGVAKASGYRTMGHFVLTESAWWDDYYNPLEKRLVELRSKYKDDGAALSIIEGTQQEIDLYRDYSDYYGYVFYIMRQEAGRS